MDYIAHLRADSERFVQALAACDPSAPVPSCPEWTAADLLWHLGEVQLFWGTIVADRLADPAAAGAAKPARPESYAELLDFARASSAKLVGALDATAPDTPLWTWFEADQSAAFVRRRQAHEALIHRLDAELTADDLTDIDAELATDGVAEVLEWMYSGVPSWGTQTLTGPVGRVVTTDTGGSWLVQLGTFSGTSPNTGNVYTDEATITPVDEGHPTFHVSGAAPDLDAWLWNRPTRTDIALGGDYAQFVEIIRAGVQ